MKTTSKIPVPIVRRGRKRKYFFHEIPVGHSALIPSGYDTVSACLRHAKKRGGPAYGMKFVVRKIEGEGVRVWRIS
jgi:hypothetical protein